MSFVFNHRATATEVFRAFLDRKGKPVTYTKGSVIIQPGDKLQNVYYIEQGSVKVYSLSRRREHYLHVLYGPSEMFPLAMLTSTLPPTVYYAAYSDCELISIPQQAIAKAMRTDIDLTREFAEKAANQFRLYSARLDNLQYKFARERLIYRLLFLAARFGIKEADGTYIIDIPMTQQFIGDSINLSRESVSREFDRLRSLGLIGYRDQNLTITDWRKLSQEFKDPVQAEWWGLD